MPSTITSYTTFTAGTKAKATEVNANFSNYRGTLLPITEATATASDSTYDLGTTEYAWDSLFANKLDIAANDYLDIINDGTTIASFVAGGFQIPPTFDYLLAGSTVASFDQYGLSGKSIGQSALTTTSAAISSINRHSLIFTTSVSVKLTAADDDIDIWTREFFSKAGSPIEIKGTIADTAFNEGIIHRTGGGAASEASSAALHFNLLYGVTSASLSTVSTQKIVNYDSPVTTYPMGSLNFVYKTPAIGKNVFRLEIYTPGPLTAINTTTVEGSYLFSEIV